MRPMTIRYAPALTITLMVLGALLLILGITLGQVLQIILGLILGVLGFLQYTKPWIKIEPHEVQRLNPLGMVLKRFPVRGPLDLVLEGNNLVHVPTGKRIAMLGFGIRKDDIAALRAEVPSRG